MVYRTLFSISPTSFSIRLSSLSTVLATFYKGNIQRAHTVSIKLSSYVAIYVCVYVSICLSASFSYSRRQHLCIPSMHYYFNGETSSVSLD